MVLERYYGMVAVLWYDGTIMILRYGNGTMA